MNQCVNIVFFRSTFLFPMISLMIRSLVSQWSNEKASEQLTFSRFSLHCGQLATSTSYALVWHQINSQKFWKMYNCKKKRNCLQTVVWVRRRLLTLFFPRVMRRRRDKLGAGELWKRKWQLLANFTKNISIYARRSVGGERRRLSEFISHLLTHFKDKGSNTLKAQLDCIYCFNRYF